MSDQATTTNSPADHDLRLRILHIVQDIGQEREQALGSVGCELYADMIMELLKESSPDATA